MNTKLFGQYLLEKGYVTRDQLLRGLAEQRASTRTLGDLAVAVGMLRVRDVDAIQIRQVQMGEPFSQAAVNLGLLTEKQIADLLHPHSAERLLLGQILLTFGYLGPKSLEEALAGHDAESVEDDTSILRYFPGSDLVDLGPAALAAMRAVFQQVLQGPVSFQPIPAVKAISAGQEVWSQIVRGGGRTFVLALQASQAEAVRVAGNVLGMPIESFDDLARDAMNEFLNIVTGHVCVNLDTSAGRITAAPPLSADPELFLYANRPDLAFLCTGDTLQITYIAGRPARALADAEPRWAARAMAL